MSPSRLSKISMYYEMLESDPTALMVKLSKLSKSFELVRKRGGIWLAQITKKVDGRTITIAETSKNPAKALYDLDNRVEKAGLYDNK